ncbi:hypothetical protein I0P70_02510 [Pontibacter sp. FD36]|nr:hypothetical protein [Pontibacter sp. FD36]
MGLGTFRMKSMKEFQQTLISRSNVNAKATDSFGPYFQLGLNAVMDLDEQTRVGLFVERSSTGGRVAYEDYSGELRYDTPVNYTALGAMLYTHEPILNSQLSFVAGIEASAFISRLRIETYGRLYNESDSSSDTFSSKGVGLKPFIGLQYPILTIPARLTFGYLASGSRAFHVPGEPDQYLVRNSDNDKLEPSWNGIRLNLSVSFPISR